ncbi:MAG: 16S rRNA (cytosine(967)-C(5))-methyltransferase RsmB [Candidatus Coatesbacteria bacterium]|nr:16S rRNA (cytosine(967)-C(5))-methyltransferase RsmB [Candidatus Coatesbacteria bacterium]
MSKVSKSRLIAIKVLHKVNNENLPAKETFQKETLNYDLSNMERRFARELIMGTLRYRGRYDYVISRLIEPKTIADLSLYVLESLRISLHQLIGMKTVPIYAAVNEGVEIATEFDHEGAGGFVNAILRKFIRREAEIRFPSPKNDPVGYLTHFLSHPQWMVERWIEKFGFEETLALCISNNTAPKITVRINAKKASREEIIESLINENVEVTPGLYRLHVLRLNTEKSITELDAWKRGWIIIQDEASTFVSLLCQVENDNFVLDLCAAPGGKTVHMAELSRDKAFIFAIDKNAYRLNMLRENLKRMEHKNIMLIKADARHFHIMKMADRILVDAPCTATGTLSKNAEGKWQKNIDDIEKISKLQLNILLNAARFLKKDGIMVYSTCSIEPEENDLVIKNFLSLKPEFKVETASRQIPADLVTRTGFMRTYPHKHGIEGIFAARLRKK